MRTSNLECGVMDDTLRRSKPSQIFRTKSLLQEINHWPTSQRMQIWLQVRPTFPLVIALQTSCDVPVIPPLVFDRRRPLSVWLIRRRLDRLCTCPHRALIYLVATTHIDMECSRTRLPAPLQPRASATNHHHRIAKANLSMPTTGSTD